MASPMFVIFLPLLWWVSRHQIYSIDLSNQQLRTVPRTLNTDVDILILKYNDLRILDASSFDLYLNLVELSVEECNITAVLDGTFDRQTKMEKVSFRRNDIRQLPTSFGPSVYTIVEMDMYTAVSYEYAFKHPYFAAFENLRRLNIGGTNSSTFDFTLLPLKVELLQVFEAQLSKFPNLSHLKNLKNVRIMVNHFTTIPRDNFDGLDNLKVLKASYNQIALMPNMSYLRALKQVILDHNLITHLPPGTLDGLQRLESIELNANQITYIYDIPYIPRLSLLDLSQSSH